MQERLVELLANLAGTSEISSFQIYKGFQRVVDQVLILNFSG